MEALAGVIVGGIIAILGSVIASVLNTRQANAAAKRAYRSNLMQQLIQASMEFQTAQYTPQSRMNAFVGPVAKAAAIGRSLGDSEVAKTITSLAAMPINSDGLSLINYVMEQVGERLNKLGGV